MRKNTHIIKRLLAFTFLVCLVSVSNPAIADTKKTDTTKGNDISSSVIQSYNADPSVQIGMLVQLKAKDPTTVVPLDSKSVANMLGVVIPTSNAAIVLTPENIKKQQVLVATSGHFDVLVSNQTGPIKIGNYITASAIDGVAMKAGDQQEQIVGKAAGNFSGTSNVISSVKLKDSLGRDSTVAVSRIAVDINIAHNPLLSKTSDYVPSFMSNVATTVTGGKSVSAARIYLGALILFITAVITGNMLYSGVHSGMIAVGRNPLSKKSIIRSLIQTVIAGLIIFVAGIFAVYLLLKL